MRRGWLMRTLLVLSTTIVVQPARAQTPAAQPTPAVWPPVLSGPAQPGGPSLAQPAQAQPSLTPSSFPAPNGPQPSYFPAADPQNYNPPPIVQPPSPYSDGVGAVPRRSPFGFLHADDPHQGLVLFNDVQSWRGIGDQGSSRARPSNNEGGSTGFNFATRLGAITDVTGLRWQVGGSYGVFDWDGRPFNAAALNWTEAQQQIFFTTGFFRRADDESSWSGGLVHDWMFNQSWGAYAVNPTLGQWRGQIAYAVDGSNEFGLWATLRDKGDTNLDWFGNAVHTRPIDQANLFWHHQWEFGANSWLWIGLPENSRLNAFQGGSLGDYILGGSFIAPLNDALSLYANAQYMHPSSSPGPAAYGESTWYLAVGLQFTFGGYARSKNVNGNSWLPLLPVANNGNFLVDSVRTF